MRKRITDISRDIALKLISPWYEPGVGVNPVLRADWLALQHMLRRDWLKYAVISAFAFIILPVFAAWYRSAEQLHHGIRFLGALEFITSEEGKTNLLVSFSWILFFTYLAITLMNLVNPLGGTGKRSIYDDPPVAPGFASKFLYARLLPRLSILPMCVLITWLFTFAQRGWVLNYTLYPLSLIYLLLSIGIALAFLYILGGSVLIAVWIRAISIRAFVVLMFVFVIAWSPLLTEGVPIFSQEIFMWCWRPFGSVIAVANELLSFDEIPSHPAAPLVTIVVTMMIQTALVFAMWWIALSRYFKTFGRFSASGTKH